MKTLTKLANQRDTVPVLDTVLVQDGIATATADQETYMSAPCALPDGLYNGAGFDSDMRTICKDTPAGDFPIHNTDNGEPAHHQMFDLKTLLDDMTYVSKAMSKDETRYYLCGIALHKDNMVATDGHRLHMVTYKDSGFADDIPEYSAGVIIPSNSVKLLIALMKEYKKRADEVKMTLYEQHAVFEIAGTVFQTQYVDGTYLQYERVIPDHPEENKTVLVQKEIKTALKEAKILAKIDKTSIIKIAINDTGIANLLPESRYKKDFVLSIKLKKYKTGFDLRYLADIPDGDLYFGTYTDPIKIVGGNRTSVVRPIRL